MGMVGRALRNSHSDEDSDDDRDPFNDINDLMLRMITISAFGPPPLSFSSGRRGTVESPIVVEDNAPSSSSSSSSSPTTTGGVSSSSSGANLRRSKRVRRA